MSESIHAGHLPLWNPYINFGIPQYGDMSSGYWSPVTWLIASTIGYNAYTLTLEVLLYILLGGIGMYTLTGLWKLDKPVRIIAGIAFMCCGYTTGHLQHFNWLSGAAFLPWCFWSYLQLLNNFSFKKAIAAALFFYMLVSSAHPGITICAVYFFAAVLVFHFFKNKNGHSLKTRITNIGKANGLLLLLLLILSTGMLAGYFDMLPYFVRGEKISLADSLSNPANLQSWISALLPFATVKNDSFYNTDPSMRNSYFSVVLLLFFLLAIISKKDSWQKFLLITGIIFALLSSGGIFKTFAYKFIPFIGYVRLNGEFRIFAILCFIIIAAIQLNKFIQNKNESANKIKWLILFIGSILLACAIYGMYNAFSTDNSIVFQFKKVLSETGFAMKLKTLIDTISFYDTIWIQSILQLFILWAISRSLKLNKYNLLKKIVVADMILACLLNIPFTGVGKASVAQVQAVLNKSPKGIPIPALQSLLQNDTLSTAERGLVGDWSMYNKQIGTRQEVAYPIVLKNMKTYFEKGLAAPNEIFTDKPFVFGSDSSLKSISVGAFSPNSISIHTNADSASVIVLKQNLYPHWYYKTGNQKNTVGSFGINFMSAPVNKGQSEITFSFEPYFIKWSMLISLSALVLYCILLLVLKTKPPFPSSPTIQTDP
ncbi:hypothetical protein [Ferruginibacter sp. SUN106]|uniref:hypothetical protein n=1 Tax=Ferruginibacter sp. SUN106 TaxID=2978348 RepID=UPI003D366536